MTAAQRAVYDAVVAGPRGAVVGPLLAVLHRPDLAGKWQEFGAMLRYGTSLPSRVNELAILATARHWNAQVEFYIHAQAAEKAGVGPSVIEAIRTGRRPAFSEPEEEEVYEFARQLLTTGQVSDAVYARVRDRWQPVGVVELTSVIGYYSMVAMTLNAHQIPLPDGAEPPLAFPAGGVPRAGGNGADGVTGLAVGDLND